jgi:hypothetical protein
MYITLTSIRLKSVWKFFPLSYNGMQIVKQCQKEKGFAGIKNTGFGKDHYTMSKWETEEDRSRFYRTGAHAEAMKKSAALATELVVYSFEADEFPNWKTAKRLLKEKGKVMRFGEVKS